MHQLPQGGMGVAKALGDLLLRQGFDKNGAQGLVLAVVSGGRLQEEAAARSVVHNHASPCESISAEADAR